MFDVTSCPWRIVTAAIRPTTSVGSLMVPFALVSSSGTWRIATSAALMTWRAGMATAATTSDAFWAPAWPACCCAWLSV